MASTLVPAAAAAGAPQRIGHCGRSPDATRWRWARTLGLDQGALAQVLMRGSGRSLGVEIASRTRTSPEMRERAIGPLEKDVGCLTADAAPAEAAAVPLFTDAAREAIRRLADPDRRET